MVPSRRILGFEEADMLVETEVVAAEKKKSKAPPVCGERERLLYIFPF